MAIAEGKRMKQSKMPADPNRRAKATVDAIDAILDRWPESEPLPDGKDPERVARGKVSGAKGGKVRAERLSPERRREIARKAAQARWSVPDEG
jgi:hypothetical protein